MLLSIFITLPLFIAAVLSDVVETAEDAKEHPVNPIKVTVNVTFPDVDAPLRVTVYNRHVSKININVQNNEIGPLGIDLAGGALWDADHTKILKNLSTHKVNAKVQPEESVIVPFSFITDMRAQDVILELGLVMTNPEGSKVSYTAYNGTISVAETPTSLLDPQVLFLYLVITSLLGGLGYFAYNTWVVPMLPKKKKVRTVRPPVVDVAPATGIDTGKGYDESWIPEYLTRQPIATKVRGAPQRTRSGKKVE